MMCLWASYKKKTWRKKIFFFASLNSMKEWVGSGSAPKCHGSPTMGKTLRVQCRKAGTVWHDSIGTACTLVCTVRVFVCALWTSLSVWSLPSPLCPWPRREREERRAGQGLNVKFPHTITGRVLCTVQHCTVGGTRHFLCLADFLLTFLKEPSCQISIAWTHSWYRTCTLPATFLCSLSMLETVACQKHSNTVNGSAFMLSYSK